MYYKGPREEKEKCCPHIEESMIHIYLCMHLMFIMLQQQNYMYDIKIDHWYIYGSEYLVGATKSSVKRSTAHCVRSIYMVKKNMMINLFLLWYMG